MKREDKIADALAEKLVDSFGGKAIEVIEILISLEKVIQRKERLAFADYIYDIIEMWELPEGLEEEFKAKIKELRSNPLPKQSVGGKRSEGNKPFKKSLEGKDK